MNYRPRGYSLKLKKVESSTILGIGYDKYSRIMVVKFKGGMIYIYPNISENLFNSVVSADSVGRQFASMVKPFHEDYLKIEDFEVIEEKGE